MFYDLMMRAANRSRRRCKPAVAQTAMRGDMRLFVRRR